MTESAESVFGLIQKPSPGGWRAHDVPIKVAGRPVRLARNGDGRPCLLVPAPGHAAGTLLVTRGLKAHVQAVADGEAYEDWLIVTSLDAHLDSTFFRLCDSVLRQLAAVSDNADGVDTTIRVVERWRELLESVDSPILGDGPCAGLLAELHALEHLTTRIGVNAAITSWVGHDRARVDFRFAGAGVEVKATLHRDRFLVTIHGLLQMDPHGVGSLYLFAQQLERVPSGGDSIPDAIGRLVTAGHDEAALRKALAGLGYLTADEDIYRELRFSVLDRRGVEVGDKTPRIVKESFAHAATAEAVSAVTYAVDLSDLSEAQGRLADPWSVFAKATQ